MGSNINGPSLIRAPGWVENPLGRYYLYFAHHQGKHIRLAFADHLEGPWSIYSPGVLDLEDSYFTGHIASPDVHIDEERREICMYYHGPTPDGQKTRVAVSKDGLRFSARSEILGGPYFRVFNWGGWWYAMAMPGIFYRSLDGLTGFEEGPRPFSDLIRPPRMMRHSAFMLSGDDLSVFYSCIGDTPERILMSDIRLVPEWEEWKHSPEMEILCPETDWEGADLPVETSVMGWAPEPVRQLRDPCIFREGDRVFLLYSVAGEQGIAITELSLD